MKELILAEKPSVARDIARVLQCNKAINGGYEGNQYIVTWALGHLVTLADPEEYGEQYKTWNLETLPIIPEQFKYEVIKKTSKQYNAVKQLMLRNDVSNIIIATDAGREGELVARLILLKVGNKKPLKRLWISSVTDRAIKEGFESLRDGKEYENLYDAAMSRAQADWIVGINATRALTSKYNAQLSCGRVQTPTISMIAKREDEIKNFISKPFYGLKAEIEANQKRITFTWRDKKNNSTSSFQEEYIKSIYDTIDKERKATVVDVKRKEKKEYAPLLYDLTELQRDANRLYNFSAKQTLNLMQSLYEHHKVLTYPRTDSRYLTEDIVDTFKDRLRAINYGEYKPFASKLLQSTFSKKASFINNSKVSDHHAIIPTEEQPKLLNMSTDEKRIYELVIRRFLAVLMPPSEYEQSEITLKIGQENFIARGNVVKQIGFKQLYQNNQIESDDNEEIREQNLPLIQVGDFFEIFSIQKTTGKTNPPKRFTEATLLSAMENPVRYMETQEKSMVKVLGETGGLGTVATRADIIEKLFQTYLIEKNGKEITITSKGRQLLNLVPTDLKTPELTASWEMKLSNIAAGKLKKRVFLEEIKKYSKQITEEIKGSDTKFKHDNLTNKKCPDCGKNLLEVKGKNTTMLVCQDRMCGYRETIKRTSNARCPVCHKKLELTGKGENQTFCCSCGYKEKLAAFTQRRKKEGAGVKKKDVSRYLAQQKKNEEPLNNAFADAFAKLKL